MGGRKVKEIKAEDRTRSEIATRVGRDSQESLVSSQEGKEAEPRTVKKAVKARKERKVRGKKYVASSQKVEAKKYPLDEAVKKVKELSYAKFDASIDAHIALELEKAEGQIRAYVALPYGTGKGIKVLVFADGKQAKDAQEKGADAIGDEELIEKIAQTAKIDFDAVIATPSFMPKLAKIARVLGPKGLMPTPKTGTVAEDPAKIVEELKKGRVELRTDPPAGGKPVVHVSIGRVSFPDEHLAANLKAVTRELETNRAKIKSAVLAPTMGPSVQIDLQ